MWNGFFTFFVCGGLTFASFADQIIAPSADGTLVDGGGYGPFDGIADSADWSFNQSSYEGAITISQEASGQVQHRLTFEFNLSSITRQPPVVAGLKFSLRGAPRFPAETAIVQVYSYPSDLLETLGDFSAGPAFLVGQVSVTAFQPITLYEIDISDQVNGALSATAKRVAFRFQLVAQTQSAQAFMDALDTDPGSKPHIVFYDNLAGDFDHDNDIDVNDMSILTACMSGPGASFPIGCSQCDLSGNGRVDLSDYRVFEERHTLFGQ